MYIEPKLLNIPYNGNISRRQIFANIPQKHKD